MTKEREGAATQDRVILKDPSVRDLQSNLKGVSAPLAAQSIKAPKRRLTTR
jgi:hypothetical protein